MATELFARWRDDPRVISLIVAMVAIGAGAFWYRSAAPAGSPETIESATTGLTDVSGSFGATTLPGPVSSAVAQVVIVHVAGAVRSPGVIRLEAGSRVVDAIDAAGGPLVSADLDRLNLAAPLADGQRVYVARVDEPAGAGTLPGDGGTSPTTTTAAPVVNLNTASAADLETLPGIGPTLAAAILAERERRGGFTSIDDLRSVHGIGEGRFADLRDRVTV